MAAVEGPGQDEAGAHLRPDASSHAELVLQEVDRRLQLFGVECSIRVACTFQNHECGIRTSTLKSLVQLPRLPGRHQTIGVAVAEVHVAFVTKVVRSVDHGLTQPPRLRGVRGHGSHLTATRPMSRIFDGVRMTPR